MDNTSAGGGSRFGDRTGRYVLGIVSFVLTLAGLGTAAMAGDDSIFQATGLQREVGLLGDLASSTWSWQSGGGGALFGTQEIGGTDPEIGAVVEEQDDQDKGPSNTGKKVLAGAMSAVVPGTGQFYNGDNTKGFVMLGVEVVIWTSYFVFDQQGDGRMESSRDYAGNYAGTGGDHNDNYWQDVGAYMDSDAYNEDRLREARALQEDPSGLIYGEDAWQWVNDERRQDYQQIRADGNSAYDRRDFMIMFAVINRAVSVVDAVLGVGKPDGKLDTEVMGLNIGVEPLPSWRDPGAQCVVSRRF